MVGLWIAAMAVILPILPPDVRKGYALGYALASALAIWAISSIHVHLLPQLRRLPFYAAIGATAILYLGAIVLSSALGIVIMVGFATGSWKDVKHLFVEFFAGDRATRGSYHEQWIITLVIPFFATLILLFLVEVSRRIGPKRLLNLFLGKYRNQQEETRIFLLIDLCGSTPLAERLGAVKYSLFIRDFFDDLTEPALETSGEIVEYVGDEAIVTWRLKPGRCDEALKCYLLFKNRIESRRDYYLKEHGATPIFKAALHAGPVVATEVGQVKSQVVYHGDALNTASRVLGECNRFEAQLLVTDPVAGHLSAVSGYALRDLGALALRGKLKPLKLTKLDANEPSLIC